MVVTRPRDQAGPLVDSLEALGAEVVVAPAIRIVDPSDGGAALRASVARLMAASGASGTDTPEWIVFTSANAVRRFAAMWTQLEAEEHLPAHPAGAKVAVIGTATRDAADRAGLEVDLVPDSFVAEGLLSAFGEHRAAGARVLLPRAEVAREVLPDGLRELGFEVEVVPAYRTVPAELDRSLIDTVARADAVCFTSASAVRAFLDTFGGGVPRVVAAIGPVTARAARERGLEVAVQPTEHTVDALVAALGEHFAQRSS